MELTVKHFDDLTNKELYDILMARQAVFVVEQSCAYMDIDGMDTNAYHLTLCKDGILKAYLRINKLSDTVTRLGRIITTERGSGYGALLMKEGISAAKKLFKPETLYIEAQSYAIGFYQKAGFKVCSEEFLEDGIPHVKMTLGVS